jgi:hypothetical protein
MVFTNQLKAGGHHPVPNCWIAISIAAIAHVRHYTQALSLVLNRINPSEGQILWSIFCGRGKLGKLDWKICGLSYLSR